MRDGNARPTHLYKQAVDIRSFWFRSVSSGPAKALRGSDPLLVFIFVTRQHPVDGDVFHTLFSFRTDHSGARLCRKAYPPFC